MRLPLTLLSFALLCAPAAALHAQAMVDGFPSRTGLGDPGYVDGTIVDPEGRPVANAVLSVKASGTKDTSRTDGKFSLFPVLPGPAEVEIYAPGFSQARFGVDVQEKIRSKVAITLQREPLTFPPARAGETRPAWIGELEVRQRTGRGFYLDHLDVLALRPNSVLALLRHAPGARVDEKGPGKLELHKCKAPAVFVNGERKPGGAVEALAPIHAEDVEALEVYSGDFVPPVFAAEKSCGAVVLWLRA